MSGKLLNVGNFRSLPVGAVIQDGTGDLMEKRARGWYSSPFTGEGVPYTDEQIYEFGPATLISLPYDGPEDLTVESEFIVHGENDWGVSSSMPLYLMSDGTMRWRKP